MKLKKVIISGAPGTGKSSIIKELKNRGYFCYDEVWRKKYENPNQKNNSNHINIFSKHLFSERLKQLERTVKKKVKDQVIFYDRSIIDTISYLNTYKKNIETLWLDVALKKRYYETIFFCPLWEEIYEQCEDRKESYKESILIEKNLTSTYKKFLYKIKHVPKVDISDRVDYILLNI